MVAATDTLAKVRTKVRAKVRAKVRGGGHTAETWAEDGRDMLRRGRCNRHPSEGKSEGKGEGKGRRSYGGDLKPTRKWEDG